MNLGNRLRHKTKKERLEAFRNKCREHGLSITPQRTAVFEVLLNAEDHPCTEDVFDRVKVSFPDISLDTIYRTLTTFSEIGVVHLVEGYGEARRYDPETETHHHFRCKQCNQIVDFREKSFDKLKIPKIISNRYAVSSIKVILEGVCDQCRKK